MSRALILFLLWAALFAASFYVFAITPVRDMGFTRGLNRIEAFLPWHAGAILVALVSLFWKAQAESAVARWLRRTPAIVEGLCVLALGALFAYATFAVAP
ncbi:MAG: hypothetical protein AB7J28_04805 [Hyphomonadaceae bacterium]